jgi:hypothetical protein
MRAIRDFTIGKYLASFSNALDWSHFATMIAGWCLWHEQVRLGSRFRMDSRYAVLVSPDSQARYFKTNSSEEEKLLHLSKSLDELGQNLRAYTNISCICGERRDLAQAGPRLGHDSIF